MLELLLEPPPVDPVAYRRFVEEQIELFVETMQDAADNHWHDLCEVCGDQEEVGTRMEKWWDEQTSRFRRSLHREQRREVRRMLRQLGRTRRRVGSLKYRVGLLEKQVESLQGEGDQLRTERQVIEDTLRQVMDEALCRDCFGWRYRDG